MRWGDAAMEPNTARNHAILVAFEAGRTVAQLADDYALSPVRIRDILKDQRHRRNLSPEPFYRAMRETSS